MNTRNFREMCEAQWEKGKFGCVGLDSDYGKIPETLKNHVSPGAAVTVAIVRFNQAIVEATKDVAGFYKPNMAFYEAYGLYGWLALQDTVKHIQRVAPEVPVILDEKRGDIGNTNFGYVKAAFDVLGADAITVHPYLGGESLAPFLVPEDKGIFVLCRTSNPGAGELQDLPVVLKNADEEEMLKGIVPEAVETVGLGPLSSIPLYLYVASRTMRWSDKSNIGLVVGATYPQELGLVRRLVGDRPLLIPGVGKQGGDVKATVEAGRDSRGRGMIINSSSGIIFASKEPDFAEAARRETLKLHEEIQRCLTTGKE